MRSLFEKLLSDAFQYPANENIYDHLHPRPARLEKRKHDDAENDTGDDLLPKEIMGRRKRKRTLKK